MTIQNSDFEFMDRILDRNLSVFMTNYLFGDSIKKVANKEVAIAEKSLEKCFNEPDNGDESEKKYNSNSSGRRRSSRKSKSSK